MLQREALEACQLARRETPLAGRMVVESATAANRVAKREAAGVRFPVELGPKLRAMVWEAAGDPADGILHGTETGSVREAREILGFAVGWLREVWECLPGASRSVSVSTQS